MLGNITEDLALRCGDVIGGLMNATFGNVVELLMSVVFIWQSRQKPSLNDIVAASLLGSILSNLVLVLGMCFFFGGLYHQEQFFNVSASKANNALLFMSCIAVVLPSITIALASEPGAAKEHKLIPGGSKLISHVFSLLLLLLYCCYLYFQLVSHRMIFDSENVGSHHSHRGTPNASLAGSFGDLRVAAAADADDPPGRKSGAAAGPASPEVTWGDGDGGGDSAPEGGSSRAPLVPYSRMDTVQAVALEGEEEEPALSIFGAVLAMLIISLVVAAGSDFLCDSIEDVSQSLGLSRSFIGMIILPVAGNACEHLTAVMVAVKNKMNLALAVAVGSSIQIAIFVIPFCVTFAWAVGSDFSLDFGVFGVAVTTLAVILAAMVTSDGSSNWLLGLCLILTYCLIGVCYFCRTDPED